ncbi:MAG: class I SAM-dependent methyltransferase [Candidatus Omnitrophota bacterium]|nr:class I SAM-dependent methyltransferase [Candidatus Omnitrophota bacterium]
MPSEKQTKHLTNKLFQRAKWLLFPGLDLHTRCRYRFLPRFFRAGPIDTLDAGCGNGALAYAAYTLGNRVLGINHNPAETAKAQAFFSEIGIDASRLEFKTLNLYDLPEIGRSFDQIICSETLEHIAQDALIVTQFYNALRPGGVLHLCCPFALHPEHRLGRTSNPEDGGHVRDGYTLESYKALLLPAGFKITKSAGIGSSLLHQLDKPIRWLRNNAGDPVALPLFLSTWPLQFLDTLNPTTPFSLYIQAVKET